MKSTVKLMEHCPVAYPKLMVNQTRNIVVLFTESGKGTVVNAGHSAYSIGEYKEDWMVSNFVNFYGEVTLSN